MPRRPDTSRAAFRDYYERNHATLAIRHFPFRRYRRNHLTDTSAEPGFDCISEFWVGPIEEIAGLMAGPIGDMMRADEAKFTERPRIRSAIADPVETGCDTGGTMLLLVNGGGDPVALRGVAHTAGAGLDLLTPMDARGFPYDAILRVGGTAPALPENWRVAETLSVEPSETDPAELLG